MTTIYAENKKLTYDRMEKGDNRPKKLADKMYVSRKKLREAVEKGKAMIAEEEAKEAEKAKKVKVSSLKEYLEEYDPEEFAYRDYEDVLGDEVMYPTEDIREVIKMAYSNKSPAEIAKKTGYDEKSTITMIWNHFVDRLHNIDNPKPYKYEKQVRDKLEEYEKQR